MSSLSSGWDRRRPRLKNQNRKLLGFAACCEAWLCLALNMAHDIGLRPRGLVRKESERHLQSERRSRKQSVADCGKAQPFLTTKGEARQCCSEARTPAFPTWILIATVALLCLSCTKNQFSSQLASTTPQPRTALRVCSDPNNLPFSNKDGDGFENKLAEMIAKDLALKVEYTWWAQRRGFFRNTLKAGTCDVVMGVPASFEMALTTAPYYRSTYVFVSRANRHFAISSFDDPKLKDLRLGVQMVGDDFSNSPPAHALSRRGMIQNVKGYTLYGDYRKPNPPADIIDAVERNDIDVGIAWGPMAGYFARHSKVPLTLTPVNPQIDQPFLPFVFDISLGVRREDTAFKEQLDRILENHRDDIDKLLDDYGVPRVGGLEGRRVNAKY